MAPEASLTGVRRVEDALRDWIRPVWITGVALAGMAALVLVLLVLGIYGTVSYRISTQRQELGVRVALGAGPAAVVRAVLERVATVFGAALVVGLLLAALGDRLLSFGGVPIGDADPAVLALVSALLLVVGAGACIAPTRRALRTDPMTSLRTE